MRIRNLSIRDAQKVFDEFRKAQVFSGQANLPDYGFYDYSLTEQDFRQRLQNPELSIALEDGKNNELVAYILAYRFSNASDIDTQHDSVLNSIQADRGAVYLDQLYMRKGLPLHLAGRLADTWTTLAFQNTQQGVVTAIPQTPWKNIPSTRFAVARGFRRSGAVKAGSLELGIFSKPFWRIGEPTGDLKIEFKEALR